MKNKKLAHYEILAGLFEYPDENFKNNVTAVLEIVNNNYADFNQTIYKFSNFVFNNPTNVLEELYTRTFDVQSVATLDLGYLLFGDDYKRGKLLAYLNAEHRKANNDCGTELPDNLINLLRLLPKLEDKELQYDLVARIMLPALRKLLNEFKVEKVKLKNQLYKKQHKTIIEQSGAYGRLYAQPLKLILQILEKDFQISTTNKEKINTGFTEALKTELEIE